MPLAPRSIPPTQYFDLKVQGSQLLAVGLQAFTKLPFLGAFILVHPRVGPFADLGLKGESFG